jgi:hypothetical protein
VGEEALGQVFSEHVITPGPIFIPQIDPRSLIFVSILIYLSIYGSTILSFFFLDFGPFFSFLILYTVGRTL